jgi:hypothetical protein
MSSMSRTLIVGTAVGAFLPAGCQLKPREAKVAESVDEQSQTVEPWSARLVQRRHGPDASDAILTDVSIVEATGR